MNTTCCMLNISIVPVKMGDEEQKLPIKTVQIPLGYIEEKDAEKILDDFLDFNNISKL